jgi:hypothetical protein
MVQAWGGTNTIARALKTIEENYPSRKEEVTRKARIYMIDDQDLTYFNYIRPNWPGILTCYNNDQFWAHPFNGDDPAWYHEILVGLRQLHNPSWGGWGGRFGKNTAYANEWR